MKSQEQGFSSAQRDANRQALTCVAIASLVSCLALVIFGALLWALAPQIYPWLTAQVALLSRLGDVVLYVSPNGTGRDCNSWKNACGLQTALYLADAGDEIWVQAGVYKPAANTRSLEATFLLKRGVALYGGFAGTETDRDQRDWKNHLTVLSGDLGEDDTTGPDGVVTDPADIAGQNAYHVVTGSGVDRSAVLDGFIITAGYASATPPNIHGYGGGMFNWGGSPTLNNLVFSGNTAGKGAAYYGGGAMFNTRSSSPALTHVTFVANSAGTGGGMFNDASSPTLKDVTFSGNEAIDASCMNNASGSSPALENVVFDGNKSGNKGCLVNAESHPRLTRVVFSKNTARYGSGMYNYQSSPTLEDVVFSNNTAGHVGGAMENEDHSSPILTGVLFSGNSASHEGGAMFNTGNSNPVLTNVSFIDNATTGGSGGGGGINNYNSDPILTNVTFSGNHALAGGGISNWQSRLTLTNVTFRGNTSKNYGAAMYSQESSPTITNTIIWGNTPGDSQMLNDRGKSNVTYSLIAGGFPGDGNLSASPQLGDLWEDDSALPAFVLPPGSPAIDAGSPSLCPETDQLGLPRPVDGDGDGSARCDMGAFEYQRP